MDRKEIYQKRLAGVYSYMDAHQLDGAMFTSYENRRYYCGFTGSNGCLIITRDKVCLVTDKRYTTQAQHRRSVWKSLSMQQIGFRWWQIRLKSVVLKKW